MDHEPEGDPGRVGDDADRIPVGALRVPPLEDRLRGGGSRDLDRDLGAHRPLLVRRAPSRPPPGRRRSGSRRRRLSRAGPLIQRAVDPTWGQRLRLTDERSRVSRAASERVFVIRQWPSKRTPSSMTTTGASTSPKTRAVPRSSTRSVATMLPTTSPRTSTQPPVMLALITPLSPTIRVSVDWMRPLNLPL